MDPEPAGGGREAPFRISSGDIVDGPKEIYPAFLIEDSVEGKMLAQVTSYRSVVASLEEGRWFTIVDIPEEGGVRVLGTRRSELRHAAILAMKTRATACLKQFVYYFLVDDGGQPDPGLNGDSLEVSDLSRLSIFDGLPPSVNVEPGTCLVLDGRPIEVAYHFSKHVRTATRRGMDGMPAPSAPQMHSAGVTQQSVSRFYCRFCEEPAWFRPCCAKFFCYRCYPRGSRHEHDCTIPRLPIPVPPPYFTTDDGDRPPNAFVELHRPEWEMYDFIIGHRFVLSSYYRAADAYYFKAKRGIRFYSRLYHRDGPDDWAWRVDFAFTVTPTKPVVIRWDVFMRR